MLCSTCMSISQGAINHITRRWTLCISSTIQDKLLTMDPIIVTCVPIRHVF